MADVEVSPVAWQDVRLPGLGSDSVALVTGASGSIGSATTAALAALGVRVAAMGRSGNLLRDLASDVGDDQVLPVVGDVSQEADALGAVSAVLDRWQRLDVLVHLAAVADTKTPLTEVDVDQFDRVLAVNVRGTLLMARAAAAVMRRQGKGRIVTVSSIAASRVAPGAAAYPASKAAVLRLTRQLAVDLGPYGITVNCVSPGQTPALLRRVDELPGSGSPPTPGAGRDSSRIPVARRGVLDDYVGPILFLASDLAQYVTGAEILAEGGAALRR